MNIDIVTLLVYFVFVLVIGGIFSRYNRNLGDFARGGTKGTWWMVGTSMLMAGISAFTFTGNGSAAFEAGPSVLAIYIANILAFGFGGLFLARWYRQTRAYTSADVIRGRFGPIVEQFTVYVNLLLSPLSAAVQLWALAVFVNAVFGLSVGTLIVVIGVVTVAYSASGGMWAVMSTDVVQGIILFGITIMIAVLALIEIGGLGEFFSRWSDPELASVFALVKEPGAYPTDRYTWLWLLAIPLGQFLGQINLGASAKYLAAKDGREASRAAWWAMALMIVGACVWFIPPMIARMLYADEVLASGVSDPATTAYAVTAMHVLPRGMMGVMIATMFSATMSSMDMGLNNQTSIIVRNLLPRLRGVLGLSPLVESGQLRLCRFVTVALGIIIITLSLLLARQTRFVLFEAFLLLGSVIVIPMLLPLIAGLVFRRLPAFSFFVILGAALIPSVYSLLREAQGEAAWTIQSRTIGVVGFGLAASIICRLLVRFQSEAQRQRERELFTAMDTPIDYAREVGSDLDVEQAAITGRIVQVLGLLIALFLMMDNPLGGRIAILMLSLAVIATGSLLRFAARRHARRRSRTENAAP